MLNITINTQGLDKLQNQIDFVEKMLSMKTDVKFQNEIQKRVLDTVKRITSERLTGGTTNDEIISEYSNNHKIRTEDDGFILYNNTMIPANVKGVQNDIANYPDGMFSVAMAFEYGVGIVGMKTGNPNAWEYNINTFKQENTNYGKGYNFGWILPKEVAEKYGIPKGQEYGGYEGFEIYRYTAEEVKKLLNSWVKEYYRKEVK